MNLACLCGLAKRDYLGNAPSDYSNADCFILYGPPFEKELPHFASIARRRDGSQTMIAGAVAQTHEQANTIAVSRVSLDTKLLDALSQFRDRLLSGPESERWAAWQEAIDCFNQANTDSEGMRWQVEWVLMAGAIQRLLQAPSNHEKFAEAVCCAMVPVRPLLFFDVQILKEWASEFYRLRGDFAHARLKTHKAPRWKPHQHLLFGALTFPILVRAVLEKEGVYEMDEHAQSEVAALSALLLGASQGTASGRSWRQFVGDQRWILFSDKIAQEISQTYQARSKASTEPNSSSDQ